MNDTTEDLVNYLFLLVIGGVVLWLVPGFFAFFAFAVTLGLVIHGVSRIWKLVKVSHASTNAKLLVLAAKLGVTDTDYEVVLREARRSQPQSWRAVEKDLKDIGFEPPER
jgi:hypothetical protein